jgi:hypothetical protein
METKQLPLALNDLATPWTDYHLNDQRARPGLCNPLGSIQLAEEVTAFRHPIFPAYSGAEETTMIAYMDGEPLMGSDTPCSTRWRPDGAERSMRVRNIAFTSETTLLWDRALVLEKIELRNGDSKTRNLRFGLLLSGRSVVQEAKGYAWAVPRVPNTVFDFVSYDGLYQTADHVQEGIVFANDSKTGWCTHLFDPAPHERQRDQLVQWDLTLDPGEQWTLTAAVSFDTNADRGHAEAQNALESAESSIARTKAQWEVYWHAAFDPANEVFSGYLPIFNSSSKALLRLYYNAVLTVLMSRRRYVGYRDRPLYLTLWPRRGEGSGYLAWELPYTSTVLALLDPDALEFQLRMVAEAPFFDYQVTNFFTQEHGGWKCISHPVAISYAMYEISRFAGRSDWRSRQYTIKTKATEGFQGASQGHDTSSRGSAGNEEQTRSGTEVLKRIISWIEDHEIGNSGVIDGEDRGAFLECISDYAHGTAAFSAFAYWLWGFAENLGITVSERSRFLKGIRSLYEEDGYFRATFPSEQRDYHPANLYDIGGVFRFAGDSLPSELIESCHYFVKAHLATEHWASNLWRNATDVVSSTRADHQWSGCFSAWPPQYVMGALRSGVEDGWLRDWVDNFEVLVDQGPFAQAYWIERVAPARTGLPDKVSDEYPQGNHWSIMSGAYFFNMIVEGIMGIEVDDDGTLRKRSPTSTFEDVELSLQGLRTAGGIFDIHNGNVAERKSL